ncbi:NifB/NifX family molybdenum-iron cluster-binding protein [Thermodesulfovibrio thiophilus]|uniref:NifB/NifX family molybdenum-iron cluster-binding protein n=1 Tax=Thermodesulfovibrio thiophilus TaxID=340095 RepID=UPI00041A95F5|nr:NifB/NifX family molybdenum-iron cluster-binding protein [Thermodesulfovibrio thiophilus]
MKICITSEGKDLNSQIDSRFGRCKYFIIYDTETMQYEALENSWKEAIGGAGIQAAQFVVQKGAKKVITGRVGSNAEMVLKKAGVSIFDFEGKVTEAIKKLMEEGND